ncbi:MAG: hypothetical protein M1472_00420 [Planctomycetes bacterium]|jgi:purine-cytosine permease-like protein|nr:hypothetical protein [Planctomycetota bacterium]
MKKSAGRKGGTIFALLWWGRKALALSLILAGWAVMLWWLFGTESTKFAIDGGTARTWKTELEFARGFWPVVGPIWLGVILLGVCGPVAVFFGRRWHIWVLRIISIPMGALATWALVDVLTGGNGSTPAKLGNTSGKLECLSVLVLAIAPWIIPIRRRKSLSPSEGSASSTGGG